MASIKKGLFTSALGLSALYLVLQIAMHFSSELPVAQGNHFAVDRYWLHYVCRGTGSTVVLFESDRLRDAEQSWSSIARELQPQARVCYYDRLGFGWSTPQPDGYDSEQKARHLAAVIKEIKKGQELILVAHGYGGILARKVLSSENGLIDRLILIDSEHEQQDARLADLSPPPAEWQAQLHKVAAISGVKLIWHWLTSGQDATRTDSRVTMHRASVEYANVMLNFSREGALTTPLAELNYHFESLPSLLLTHDTGNIAANENAELWMTLQQEMADLFTQADIRVIKGAGHDIPAQRPDAVIEAIRSFL